MKMHWLIVQRASEALLFGLVLAIAGDVIIFIFVDYGMPSEGFSGCYAYDAMLIGFECKGFPAASLVSAWLNWPLWLLYGPLFAAICRFQCQGGRYGGSGVGAASCLHTGAPEFGAQCAIEKSRLQQNRSSASVTRWSKGY